jgi:hypothetical protein
MTIGPDHSTLAGLLNQLAAILADAVQVVLAVNKFVAEQTSPSKTEPDFEDCDALMRFKDDGCPNGE